MFSKVAKCHVKWIKRYGLVDRDVCDLSEYICGQPTADCMLSFILSFHIVLELRFTLTVCSTAVQAFVSICACIEWLDICVSAGQMIMSFEFALKFCAQRISFGSIRRMQHVLRSSVWISCLSNFLTLPLFDLVLLRYFWTDVLLRCVEKDRLTCFTLWFKTKRTSFHTFLYTNWRRR